MSLDCIVVVHMVTPAGIPREYRFSSAVEKADNADAFIECRRRDGWKKVKHMRRFVDGNGVVKDEVEL